MRTRRTRPIATAAVLLAALIGAITVLMVHNQPLNGRRRTVTPTRVTPRGSPGRSATAAQACPPVAAIDLAAWRWADFHGIALPVSATDGPSRTVGGLASGFTHRPAGALLAAINIAVRTAAQWGPAIYIPTISRQVTGPGKAALLGADTATYTQLRAAAHVRPGKAAGRGDDSVAAYRFATCTPAAAAVDVVTAGAAADGALALADTRVGLVWVGGDWRVIAPPGGSWANSATAITSLTGYTIFPGEG